MKADEKNIAKELTRAGEELGLAVLEHEFLVELNSMDASEKYGLGDIAQVLNRALSRAEKKLKDVK